MDAREFFNRFGLWIALPVLAFVSFFAWYGAGNKRDAARYAAPPAQKEFYDTESGEIVQRPATEVPPLLGRSGQPTLVEARYVVLPDGSRQLRYLLKYTPAAKAAFENASARPLDPAMVEEVDPLVASPANVQLWVNASSPQGRQITGQP